MDNRENTLAANPLSISFLDPGVVKGSSFVHPDAAIVGTAGERDLIGMEVIKA
jgi:hypothetical protein